MKVNNALYTYVLIWQFFFFIPFFISENAYREVNTMAFGFISHHDLRAHPSPNKHNISPFKIFHTHAKITPNDVELVRSPPPPLRTMTTSYQTDLNYGFSKWRLIFRKKKTPCPPLSQVAYTPPLLGTPLDLLTYPFYYIPSKHPKTDFTVKS